MDDRKDLCNLCHVSKNLYSLVIPHLYRNIQIGAKPPSPEAWLQSLTNDDFETKEPNAQWDDSRALVRRLVQNPNGLQAQAVREVEGPSLEQDEEDEGDDFPSESEQDDLFAGLVRALPKLRVVRSVAASLVFRKQNDDAPLTMSLQVTPAEANSRAPGPRAG